MELQGRTSKLILALILKLCHRFRFSDASDSDLKLPFIANCVNFIDCYAPLYHPYFQLSQALSTSLESFSRLHALRQTRVLSVEPIAEEAGECLVLIQADESWSPIRIKEKLSRVVPTNGKQKGANSLVDMLSGWEEALVKCINGLQGVLGTESQLIKFASHVISRSPEPAVKCLHSYPSTFEDTYPGIRCLRALCLEVSRTADAMMDHINKLEASVVNGTARTANRRNYISTIQVRGSANDFYFYLFNFRHFYFFFQQNPHQYPIHQSQKRVLVL
jgi:hypothetical protein